MSETERRSYLITGELPHADWDLLVQIAGRVGLDVSAADSGDLNQHTDKTVSDLPYNLAEVKSSDQYIAQEHLAEFWPTYRRETRRAGERPAPKYEALTQSLTSITDPRVRGARNVRPTNTERIERAARLGLRIIVPRTDVGFPPELRGGSYSGSTFLRKPYGVVEAGSLIRFMNSVDSIPRAELPANLNRDQVHYLGFLANQIAHQIAEAGPD